MNKKYHTYETHIKPMLQKIDSKNLEKEDVLILKLAAIFHDSIYDPTSKTNEYDSISFFRKFTEGKFTEEDYQNDIIKNEIGFLTNISIDNHIYVETVKLIENTQNPFNMRYGNKLGNTFARLDIDILTLDFSKLIDYEHAIYNEYKNTCVLNDYKFGRIQFLNKAIKTIPDIVNVKGLEQLIEYVEKRDYGTVGIFAGSFNPFHIGHYNVLEQARKDFDSIIVVQMQDFSKPQSDFKMPKLEELVIKSDRLLVEVFNQYKIGYKNATIIRALRNGDDLQHEQNLKQIVNDFDSSVRFTYYLADKDFSHISSSMVRSLPWDIKNRYIYT